MKCSSTQWANFSSSFRLFVLHFLLLPLAALARGSRTVSYLYVKTTPVVNNNNQRSSKEETQITSPFRAFVFSKAVTSDLLFHDFIHKNPILLINGNGFNVNFFLPPGNHHSSCSACNYWHLIKTSD